MTITKEAKKPDIQTPSKSYIDKLIDMQLVDGKRDDIIDFFNDPRVAQVQSIETLCELANVPVEKFGKRKPSTYQLGFFKVVALPYIFHDLKKYNVRMIAVAGSGKSYCLVKACHFIPRKLNILICCFSVKIREEMESKLSAEGLHHVKCKGIHSLAFGALRNNFPNYLLYVLKMKPSEARQAQNVEIDEYKAQKFVKEHFATRPHKRNIIENKNNDPDDTFSKDDYMENIHDLLELSRCFLVSLCARTEALGSSSLARLSPWI